MKISDLFSSTAAAVLLLASVPVQQSLAGDSPASAGWRQVAYSCESGQALNVAYREPGRAAQVTVPDKPPVKLIARPSRVGFRYSDDRYELRGQGDEVTWQIGSKTPVKCTSEVPPDIKVAAVVTP